MSEDKIEDVFGAEGEPSQEPEASTPETPAPKKAAPKKAAPKKAAGKEEVKRTRITLQKNPDIPPSGLFIGHNGVGYELKPGQEVDVPDFLLNVLDDAVYKKPVVGPNGRVTHWEDSPRFPYQVVRNK